MGGDALDRMGAIQPNVLSKGPGVFFTEVALCSYRSWTGLGATIGKLGIKRALFGLLGTCVGS